jgi:hypothetical protein
VTVLVAFIAFLAGYLFGVYAVAHHYDVRRRDKPE